MKIPHPERLFFAEVFPRQFHDSVFRYSITAQRSASVNFLANQAQKRQFAGPGDPAGKWTAAFPSELPFEIPQVVATLVGRCRAPVSFLLQVGGP
jgi:hypothetical protein